MDLWRVDFVVLVIAVVSRSGYVLGHTCYATVSSPCQCQFVSEGKSINISYFDEHPLNYPDGNKFFTYSPCHAFQCNSNRTDVRMCQYMTTTKQYVGIGRIIDYHHSNPWTLNSLSPLTFTIQYNGGDEIISEQGSERLTYSTVQVVYDEYKNGSSFTYEGSEEHGEGEYKYKHFKFTLITSDIVVEDISDSTKTWIAGAVVGSWAFLVVVLAVIVTTIIWVNVKRYKRRQNYEQLPYPVT